MQVSFVYIGCNASQGNYYFESPQLLSCKLLSPRTLNCHSGLPIILEKHDNLPSSPCRLQCANEVNKPNHENPNVQYNITFHAVRKKYSQPLITNITIFIEYACFKMVLFRAQFQEGRGSHLYHCSSFMFPNGREIAASDEPSNIRLNKKSCQTCLQVSSTQQPSSDILLNNYSCRCFSPDRVHLPCQTA